jgi:uncharacterized coiled-coil protein SlyX
MLQRFRRRERPLDGSFERRLDALEVQVSRLNQVVEGLQDALHRESVRRDDEAALVRKQMAPRELARALSEDSRRRGLQ